MKKLIKYSNYFGFALALCVMVLSGCSCSAPKPTPDPLAGWQKAYNPDSTIVKDYQEYVQNLSPDERTHIAYYEFFQDATGQHAVKITIGLNNANWRHILIYDKTDKRIKVIKYVSGHSMS